MHSASYVKFGSSQSSAKDVSVHNVDPASFLSGLCVSMASTGLPSLLASAGMRMGVSMGRSLSDHKKLAVLRTGERVPIRAHLKRSSGVITITNVANLVSGTDDIITVGATGFTAQAGAAVLGDATFQAAGSTSATATSLAAQINAHAVASLLVYAVASSATVTLYAVVEGAGTGHDVALSYTDGDANIGATVSVANLAGGSNTISSINYATIGSKMYINNATGKADVAMSGFSTVSDAVYVVGPITGLDEDNAESAAVIVDMGGGL